MMIHNPWVNASGDAEELRKTADVLDKTRDALISGYARSGKSRAEIITMLDAETWFTADEALSVDSLGSARAAMRRQKGIAGTSHIDPQPRFLIVPVGLESKAEALLSSMVLYGATNNTDNLQWIRNLTLVADPRLDDASQTAWYLAASPSQIDTIVRAYLAGQSRPYYEENLEFEKDGIAIKSRLDFGCGVIDFRGLYKNPGA